MASDRAAEQFRARIVNYADDLVILSRGKARERWMVCAGRWSGWS